MRVYKEIAVIFENKDVLEAEDLNVAKFLDKGFKVIEADDETVSRIIVSEEVWNIFREKCGEEFLEEMGDKKFIWTAKIEVIPDCPCIILLSSNYTVSRSKMKVRDYKLLIKAVG